MSLVHTAFSLQGRCQHSAFLSASFLLPLLLAVLLASPGSAAEHICDAAPTDLSRSMPHGCDGPELLADPTFSGSLGSWGIHRWNESRATVQFSSPGVAVQVEKHAQSQMHDALFFQEVPLSTPSGYSLCIQGGSSFVGGVDNSFRFAVDGGARFEYAVAGGGRRQHLSLYPGQLHVACFNFELPAKAGENYLGRIAIEFGDARGKVAVCRASLMKCGGASGHLPGQAQALPRSASSSPPSTTQAPHTSSTAAPSPAPTARPAFDLPPLPPLPQVPEGVSRAPTCPTPAARLDSFSCDEENLGGELLRSAAFEGAGAWQTYTWQAGAADFYSGPAGALVDVKEQNPSKDFYAVSMVQDIELIPNGTESFELCLQAGASDAGTTIRFAVDGGMPDFHVPGSQERTELELSAGSLSSTCFRFALSPTLSRYAGRVAIELGHVVGQVAMCQVSLRRCKQKSYLPEALPAIRRCYVAPLGATQGCSKLETHSGAAFGLNALGHETDGKRACLEKLRLSGGNSFVFAPERCEIWSCADRDALVAASTGSADSAQVYSELCEYGEGVAGRQGAEARSPVFVNLWEWNFKDIARECEEFLGPNGFDAVQVMPVTEHVRDGSWFAKYQPVSMLLNSRSGTAEEFKCMVATCRAVGVEVIVDVVLNHIAKPCDAVGGHGSDAVVPCSGWAGSRFGNRGMPSGSGWDAVGPQHFHHKVDDRMSNCPVNADTFQCPESDPPGDCSQCDLFGLPDWNTELPEVQDLLARHLRELHSLGVTMLRLDAASYIHEAELSKIVNQVPWDYVFQEWWAGIPAPSRTRYVGDYRDIFFGRQITKALVLDAASELPQLVNITFGLEGLAPQHSLCPLTFHDQRSVEYLQSVPTYKGGLEFHQQQKFLLASPAAVVVRLWGGFGYADLDDGPPGCRHTDVTCDPTPVYGEDGEDRCLPTPTTTPLDAAEAKAHRWICEHRWAGVAGLVGFRKACRGLPVSETFADSVAGGNFAFRTGDTCLVAVQRKMPGSGAWSLEGIVTGLPEGRYCDLASLPTKKGWDGKSCPNEVELGPGGAVVSGVVPEGDLLAIHAGARLPDLAAAALLASPAMAKSAGEAKACAAETELSSGARALQLGALLAAALPVAAASLLA